MFEEWRLYVNRSEQKEIRKTQILMKALELFVQKGYEGTTTKEIAKELNISEGLLFHYYPTKENLYLEIVKLGLEGTEIFSGPIDKPYDFIYCVIKDFLEKVRENRAIAKMFVLMNMARNKFKAPEKVYNFAKQVDIIELSIPVIILGQKQGVFRKGDPLTLSYTFWNAFDGIMVEIANNSKMKIPDPTWLMGILENKESI